MSQQEARRLLNDTEAHAQAAEEARVLNRQQLREQQHAAGEAAAVQRAEDLKADITRFISEGYAVVTGELGPNPDIIGPATLSPDVRILSREKQHRPVEIFKTVVGSEVFDHIATKTTQEIDRKVREKQISESTAKKYCQLPVRREEIVHLLAIRQLFRARGGHRTLEDHFTDKPDYLPSWPLSLKRMQVLTSNLCCDWTEFQQILRKRFQGAINPGKDFCVDETLFEFYSKVDKSFPHAYFPNKPRKNGLLMYSATFKGKDSVPYTFDVVMSTDREHMATARESLNYFVTAWPWREVKPHVTTDAGFSGQDEMQILNNKKICFTTAVNLSHKRALFELLERYCPRGSWVAAVDPTGIVFSTKMLDQKPVYLATTGFVPYEEIAVQPVPVLVGQQDVTTLGKLTKPVLHEILAAMGAPPKDPQTSLELHLAYFLNARRQVAAVPRRQTQLRTARVPELDLDQKRVPELQEICRSMRLPTSGVRADLIGRIRDAQQVTEERVKAVDQQLKSGAHPGAAPHHAHYRQWFNGVDLQDAKWYSMQSPHPIHNWRAKFIISVLEVGMVNCFALSDQTEGPFLDFIDDLVKQLCLPDFSFK